MTEQHDTKRQGETTDSDLSTKAAEDAMSTTKRPNALLARLRARVENLPARTRWIGALVGASIVAFALGTWLGGGDAPEKPPAAGTASETASEWTCSMHPQIRQPEPGQCPICGMDLIPVSSGSDGDERDYVVSLSERAKALAQVRTEAVRAAVAGQEEVRLLGRVDYDETSLRLVTAWTGGRLDRLHVRVTGESVKRGQTVASIYSPEVYAAHQDLIQAKKQAGKLAKAGGSLQGNSEMIVEATRERLRLLGFSNTAIERMEASAKPSQRVAISTPFAGTVVERLATEGSYVTTGSPLYRIADLSSVWVQLDAYERDLPALAVGQHVELTVDALPGETIEGRVAFIDPVLDRRRRTASVRVEVANTTGKLRPGMFAEAIVHSAGAIAQMSIPASAALFTGRRSIVYVQVPNAAEPSYEARAVRLGPLQADRYPVIAGLQAGDEIVVNGAFLIDADLQIRGGQSMMTAPDDSQMHPIDEAVEVPPEFLAGLSPILQAYLEMQKALAKDDLDAARAAATTFLDTVRAFSPNDPPQGLKLWSAIAKELQERGGHMHHTGSLQAFRRAFEHISVEVIRILRAFGNPLAVPLRLAHCPMAMDDRGAEWVQEAETIDNSYFGAEMLTCGSIRGTAMPGERLPVAGLDAAAAPPGGEEHAGQEAQPAPAADPHAGHTMPSNDATSDESMADEPASSRATAAKKKARKPAASTPATSTPKSSKPAAPAVDHSAHQGHDHSQHVGH